MRKRTFLDIALLLIASAIGAWLFSLRNRKEITPPPAPTATPRALDFIKTLELPHPPPIATPTPRELLATPRPSLALLVVQVDTVEPDYAIIGELGSFRVPVQNGRAVLSFSDTTPVTLHVEDPWGRETAVRRVTLSFEESVTLDFDPLRFVNASPGLRLTPAEDHALVVAIEPGSAAAAAGIQVGDILTHIDDRACGGLSAAELREALLGEAGTAVSLRIVITNDENEHEEHNTALERR